MIFVAFVCAGSAFGRECTLELVQDPSSPCELGDLTDDVLLAICTERGFELVEDDGIVFDHDTLVEAASQCLELETEMKRILEENPELLAEFEAEQAALEEANKREEDVKQSGATGEEVAANEDEVNDADSIFHSVLESTDEIESEDVTNTGVNDEEDGDVVDLDADVVDDRAVDDESVSESESTETLADIMGELKDNTAASSGSSGDVQRPNPTVLNPASLTFAEFWTEFKDKVGSDVNRVVNLVVPKPLRGPLKGSVKRAMSLTKKAVMGVYKEGKKRVEAFIEQSKASIPAQQ